MSDQDIMRLIIEERERVQRRSKPGECRVADCVEVRRG